MKKQIQRMIAFFMVFSMIIGLYAPVVHASEVTDEEVSAVIKQLEAIDTLQQMQDKRNNYTVKNNHYDTGTTDSAVIEEHETARTAYNTYVNQMFSARIAAQQAYDALTDAQKAQIDAALVEKLNNNLPTVFNSFTADLTPSENEYTFEAVRGGTGQGYEVSNYMVSGNIPQTFILVDTSNGETTWTPSGIYEYGKSNYDVTYCCDVKTSLEYETHYKRINLEDSGYYGAGSAKKIRAILQNSYPFISMEEMKANLIADGMNEDFVNSLNRSDLISAVQMAIWTYANVEDNDSAMGYFASVSVPKNQGIYFTSLHDFSNEIWDWLPGKRQRSYDAFAEYRVNNLAYYLCSLEGVEPEKNQIVISDIQVTRVDLIPGTDDTYNVGMYIYLNTEGSSSDNIKVTATSSNSSETITGSANQQLGDNVKVSLTVKAKAGDTINVVAEGTQKLAKGVYFYEPEGGRGISQSLVGVAEGETKVRAEETFVFNEEIKEMGLRIYKTEKDTGLPLSDINFHVYKAVPGEGEILSESPTETEIAKYAVDANKVATLTTDATGYAAVELDQGTYLVVEEHNKEKIKEPVPPFYVSIPMTKEVQKEDGTTVIETLNIVSVYPKNEPVKPEEEEPTPPPPTNVTGQFEILKYDESDKSIVLEGAEFAVYRAATTADIANNVETINVICDGVQYAVVPVEIDGRQLILTTDSHGNAVSPEMPVGTYFLVETKAPAGYNLLEEAVSVTIASKESTTITLIEIANARGNILPETGGMGTTWFLVIGSIMMFGAVVMMVTKKRMNHYK